MPCACKNRKRLSYLWTPPEGSALKPMTYQTEIEAKAKVMRHGGSYKSVPKV